MRPRPALAALAVSFACASQTPPPAATPDSSGQTYPAALELFCDVDRLSGANPDDPLERERLREDYLAEHVKNPDGIYLLTVFRTRDSAGKAELLRKETREQNIAQCPLLATL